MMLFRFSAGFFAMLLLMKAASAEDPLSVMSRFADSSVENGILVRSGILLIFENSTDCEDPNIHKLEELISSGMTSRNDELITRLDKLDSLKSGASARERVLLMPAFKAEAETILALADAYLAKGCLDDADRVYRSIIKRFTGGVYEAVRQRAMIGVDDVRANRSKQ